MENIKNNLPKYWVVKNDDSQRFKDIVLQYLNNIFDKPWVGDAEGYYGYDGDINHNGTSCFYNVARFKNTPTILTIDEFIELSKPISDMIDFRVKGTKLPVIPVGTIYKCRSFDSNVYKAFDIACVFYSYGYKEIEGIIYIEAESKEYTGGVYFMIKESDIVRLAKEQGMIKEKFILPEKWWVQSTEENYVDIYTWLRNNQMNNSSYTSLNNSDKNSPICFPAYYTFHQCKGNFTYTEITFDQFNKYVLKQDTMEKEIIGYKLKEDCKQYVKAICRIEGYQGFGESIRDCQPIYIIEGKIDRSNSFNRLKEAGVLDLWFDPVYKDKFKVGDWIYCVDEGGNNTQHKEYKVCYEPGDVIQIDHFGISSHSRQQVAISKLGHVLYIEQFKEKFRLATPEEIKNSKYPNITINGYKGEFFDDYVKFGCAKIDKDLFIDLENLGGGIGNKSIESITIGKGAFTKEQIKEIAEYYNAKISK